MIQSVTGILPPEALTFCQCHEHILLSKGVSWQRNHALCMEDIQKSMQELLDYRAAGGSTIVDAQPVQQRQRRTDRRFDRLSQGLFLPCRALDSHIFSAAAYRSLFP